VQLSKHDPGIRQYIKEKNIHLLSQAAEEQTDGFEKLKLPDEVVKSINKKLVKGKHQPGKYRK
jgi:hypothetical protein